MTQSTDKAIAPFDQAAIMAVLAAIQAGHLQAAQPCANMSPLIAAHAAGWQQMEHEVSQRLALTELTLGKKDVLLDQVNAEIARQRLFLHSTQDPDRRESIEHYLSLLHQERRRIRVAAGIIKADASDDNEELETKPQLLQSPQVNG